MTNYKNKRDKDQQTSAAAAHKQRSRSRDEAIPAAQSVQLDKSNHSIETRLIQREKSKQVKHLPPFCTQKKENNTGLPDNLKSGIENISGYSMDDVKVHYNSDKPAQLHAHAHAQGTDIHLGSGQEKHLPHEPWHVVQQKLSRDMPNDQMKGKTNVNDDAGLEKEADIMGAKAIQFKASYNYVDKLPALKLKPIQGMDGLSIGESPLQMKSVQPIIQFYRSNKGVQVHILSSKNNLVTQFYPGESVFGAVGRGIGAVVNVVTHPATMLLTEFIATLVGGEVLFSVNPLAGMSVLAIAVSKYLRFCEIVQNPSGPPTAESKAKMNKLRLLEASLSGLLALLSLGNTKLSTTTKIAAGIFAVLKLTRSLLSFGNWGICGKLLLHVIQILEGVAVAIGGYNWDSPDTTTTARNVGMTVGIAKGDRGVRGIVDDSRKNLAERRGGQNQLQDVVIN